MAVQGRIVEILKASAAPDGVWSSSQHLGGDRGLLFPMFSASSADVRVSSHRALVRTLQARFFLLLMPTVLCMHSE
jgi:hypothetical protein